MTTMRYQNCLVCGRRIINLSCKLKIENPLGVKYSMATVPVFSGENYDFWCVKMKTLFLSMDLWDIVANGIGNESLNEEGSSMLTRSQETELKEKQRDAAALSKIQQGVSDTIFPKIMRATKAKEAWDILQQEFQVVKVDIINSKNEGAGPGSQNVIGKHDEVLENIKKLCEENKRRKIEETNLIVAALIATVSFAAGFTVPGGYDGNQGTNQGMVVLSREAAFKTFMVTDTLALALSVSTVILYSYAAMMKDEVSLKYYVQGGALNSYATIAMLTAFAAGTRAALPHPSNLVDGVYVFISVPVLVAIYMNCKYDFF